LKPIISTVANSVMHGAPENLDFGAFWDLRNHVRRLS